MAHSYLTETDLFDAFNDSNKYMRPLFEPFTEYERIARNRPHPGIDKAYPKVTDGTTSSVIEKTPRRILQKVPGGLAHSAGEDWITPVAGFILNEIIIPNANSQYSFLQKVQAGVGKALTYGSQPGYVPFINRGKYFGTDLTLPYIKDVFLEPGKVSDMDSNFILMRAWYQKRDIKAIIATAKDLEGKGVETGWDLAALAEIEDQISQKDDLSTTPNERARNNRSGGVEIIHAFQRGIGGMFYSYHMKTKKIVRRRKNKDPRGEMPIHYMYAGVDVSNPLGRGFVEMVGAMQNLMDAEVQMYQYNRALMLNPPMVKRGEWNKSQAKLAPNVLVDIGNSPTSSWEPVKIDSSALNNFAGNYGLMQSQILQLLSSPNSTISSDVGSVSQSKTQAGVKQNASNLNVDDTYIRNQSEAWLQKIFGTQLNLYFAERTGKEELQLDQETADKVREIDESLVNKDNKIRIDYDKETKSLTFEIDAGSSEEQDDTEEITELKEVLADVNANPEVIPAIQKTGKDLQLGEVYVQLFQRLGLKDVDKIMPDLPKDEQGNPVMPEGQAPPMTPEMVQQMVQEGLQQSKQQDDQNDIANHPIVKLMTSLNIKFTDLPEDSKHEVLEIIGVPSDMSTPTQNDQAMKAITTAHTINSSTEQQQTQQAQMEQDDKQNQASNEIAAKAKATPEAETVPPQQPQTGITEDDQPLIEQMQSIGIPEDKIGQALALLHHGTPPEDVLQMITQGAEA